MNDEEIRLIKGFFNDGYCCDLDELKNIANKMIKENQKLQSNWNSLREYIINEFLDGNLEWHRNNSSTISGSDLPNECILELLDKMNELEGKDN